MMELLVIPVLAVSCVIWLAFCILAGVVASSRNRSGFGYFMLSVLFTPLLGILAAALLPALPLRDSQATQRVARQPFTGKSTQQPGWTWDEFVRANPGSKPRSV